MFLHVCTSFTHNLPPNTTTWTACKQQWKDTYNGVWVFNKSFRIHCQEKLFLFWFLYATVWQISCIFVEYPQHSLNIMPQYYSLNIMPHVREDNVTAFLCGKSVHLCNCIDMWWRVEEFSRHSTKAPNFRTNQNEKMLFRTILHIFVKLSI